MAVALFLAMQSTMVPAQTETFRRLRGPEIVSRLTGMEFIDDVHWATVFQKGGRVRSVSMGKPGAGSWQVVKDELCVQRAGEEARCYEVWISSKQNVQLRHDPAPAEEGVLRRPNGR